MHLFCFVLLQGVTIADGVGFETSKFGLDFNLSTTTEIHHFCDETKPLTPDMALMFAGAIVMMFAQVWDPARPNSPSTPN